MKIIEDGSPYYIRFTHDKIEETINLAKKLFEYDKNLMQNGFDYINMNLANSLNFFRFSPVYNNLPQMNISRATYFISKPKFRFPPHTDGLNHKWGINYPILILDDKCNTNWYSNIEEYEVDISYSKILQNFKYENHIPVKSVVLRPDECMLINIGLFHNWDNSKSDNYRIVLTTRLEDHLYDRYDFDDAKKMLFGS